MTADSFPELRVRRERPIPSPAWEHCTLGCRGIGYRYPCGACCDEIRPAETSTETPERTT